MLPHKVPFDFQSASYSFTQTFEDLLIAEAEELCGDDPARWNVFSELPMLTFEFACVHDLSDFLTRLHEFGFDPTAYEERAQSICSSNSCSCFRCVEVRYA